MGFLNRAGRVCKRERAKTKRRENKKEDVSSIEEALLLITLS